MNYKQYLSSEGFLFSSKNGHWIKGKGFGRSIKVTMLMRGLFEIRQDNEVVFSHFIESFNEFKDKIEEHGR